MYLDAKRLVKGDALLNSLPKSVTQSAGGITLVITHEESCWIIEQKSGGVPEKAYVVPCDDFNGVVRDFDGLRTLLNEADLLVGLPLINGIIAPNTKTISFPGPSKDVVTTVPSSDKFDDYRPARPEDFVGRDDLISELIGFLGQVRNGTTDTRLLALSGPSGFGKSSVVLNLAAKCRNLRWRTQFYTYPIDTRSAVSPLFVAEAVLGGFKQAISDGFLVYDAKKLSIDSVENPFSSQSMVECLEWLKQQNRVLILFFDQFEELFVKEALADTFVAFKRLSILVEAQQSNVVLGFSWRTGISIPDSHPAITVWQELRDRRYEVKIPPFDEKDAQSLVNKLEKEAETKIDKTLRRHLVEQSRYLPWLLKKFCVHVYRKLKAGVSQRERV